MIRNFMPGAEPWSADGGPDGALCLHGFTGNPSSMRGVAEAFAAAGFAVELPRLPGHGTTVEDMITDRLGRLAGRRRGRLPAPRRAGATRSWSSRAVDGRRAHLWLAARHPEIAGIVVHQPAHHAAARRGPRHGAGHGGRGRGPHRRHRLRHRRPRRRSSRPTRRRRCAAAVVDRGGRPRSRHDLGRITCPVLIMTCPHDHVVEPVNVRLLAAAVAGPVERVRLERSYHVATLDYDRELVCRAGRRLCPEGDGRRPVASRVIPALLASIPSPDSRGHPHRPAAAAGLRADDRARRHRRRLAHRSPVEQRIGKAEDASALALWAVPAGIIGARHLPRHHRPAAVQGPLVPRRSTSGRAASASGAASPSASPSGLWVARRRGIPLLPLLDVAAPGPRAGAGHRSLGQLLEPGAVRPADHAAVGPRVDIQAGRGLYAVHHLPPDVPVRVAVEPRPVRRAPHL